jgi:hypothetical protein
VQAEGRKMARPRSKILTEEQLVSATIALQSGAVNGEVHVRDKLVVLGAHCPHAEAAIDIVKIDVVVLRADRKRETVGREAHVANPLLRLPVFVDDPHRLRFQDDVLLCRAGKRSSV